MIVGWAKARAEPPITRTLKSSTRTPAGVVVCVLQDEGVVTAPRCLASCASMRLDRSKNSTKKCTCASSVIDLSRTSKDVAKMLEGMDRAGNSASPIINGLHRTSEE